MAQNTGTLISAAIRPNDSLDPIASAFATEIKGGLHTTADITTRNSIIFERREWGMMCYVQSMDKTYQLKYNYVSTSIMDNNNWVEFNGSGGSGGGGNEWIDSVISISNTPPGSPNDGDRYILGNFPSGGWISLTASLVLTYNSSLATWQQTIPTNGTSVIVDNEDNSIYKYVGNFPSGLWIKEKINQLRSLAASTGNGYDYTATSNPSFLAYDTEIMFLAQFSSFNTGTTVSIDINGLGPISIKKPSVSGLVDPELMDIQPNIIYNLTYDGTNFQINRPYVDDDVFSVKYFVEPTDYIVVPQYYQYWVYSDLQISGTLVNYGQVIIANGSLILSGGTFSNFGTLAFVSFAGTSSQTTYNDSFTIQFTQSNTILGPSVSATVIDGSLTQSKLDIANFVSGTGSYVLSYTSSGQFFWLDSTSFGVGSITGVTAGLGLTGGGNSGYLSLDVNIGMNSGLTFSGDDIIIDSNIAGNGLAFSSGILDVNVSNGLEIISDVIQLGGTLSQNTSINSSNFDITFQDFDTLTLTGSVVDIQLDNGLYLVDAGDSGSIDLYGGDVMVYATGSVDIVSTNEFTLFTGTGSVTTTNLKGLEYSTDYSGTFVTNSLVSKKYVDDQVSLINGDFITGVTAGSGISGGGTSGFISLNVETTINKGLSFSTIGDSGTLEVLLTENGGLTFSSGGISPLVDNVTITVNGIGQLTSVLGSSTPIYEEKFSLNTSGDYQPTGFTLSFTPNDYSRMQVFINGQIQTLGNGVSSSVDCYFWDGFSAVILSNLQVGDELYWNGIYSGFDLSTIDTIFVTYEA